MTLPGDINRRAFLARGPALGAALAAGPAMAAQAPTVPHDGVLRVGCLNVMTYSHLPHWWGPLINPREAQKDLAFTGMRMTHCWDLEAEHAKQFAQKFGCAAVERFDDMVGEVDAIISGGYHCHGWNHILHEPYLKAGLPNLINRPFSNALAKANRMIDAAQTHGTPILNPSAYEHNDTIDRAQAWVKENKVLCYNATTAAEDYPTHGVHGVYMVVKVIAEAGNPIVSVSYRAQRWDRTPGVLTFEHRDAEGRPFFGTLHLVPDSLGTIRIHTAETYGGKGFEIYTGSSRLYGRTSFWGPTLWQFEKMARTGVMPESYDQILHKQQVFLAGWYSMLKRQGGAVRLDEVPEDWQSPIKIEGRPDNGTVDRFREIFGG